MLNRRQPSVMTPTVEGLLVIDKPAGITSRAAVDQVLGWFGPGTRVGHTGTLDPLATGVLVLCFGTATRLAEYVQRMSKVYRATLLLGATSDTDDADGRITINNHPQRIEEPLLAEQLAGFVGAVEQVPPAYSAARLDGRRAYDLARRGAVVTLSPRTVQIYGIDLLRYEYPEVELEVRCGKGTYIRSLARDLGTRLGCGAYIRQLRRTRVGPFAVEQALSLETEPEIARGGLLPNRWAVAELPTLKLSDAELTRLRCGQDLALGDESINCSADGEIAVFDQQDELILVARLDRERRSLHADKVLRR